MLVINDKTFIVVLISVYLTPVLCITTTPSSITEHFRCRDGSEINGKYLCDGEKHCPHGDDELGCDFRSDYACEGEVLKMKCKHGEEISVINGNYGRYSTQICTHNLMSNVKCKSLNSFHAIKKRCEGKTSCEIPSNNGFFGDPCVNTYKYTEVHYKCIKAPPCQDSKFQCDDATCIDASRRCDGNRDCNSGEDELQCSYITEYACEHSKLNIVCGEDEEIKVFGANYGRSLPYICNLQKNTNCISQISDTVVKHSCDGKSKCDLHASNSVFGDPCHGTIKYLAVNYLCVNNANGIDLRLGVKTE